VAYSINRCVDATLDGGLVDVMAEKCLNCDEEATLICQGCGKLLYCGEEHRKKSSTTHKTDCRPYRVERNEKYGR
jgi:hypothetical protein